jgi:hypothetical protein
MFHKAYNILTGTDAVKLAGKNPVINILPDSIIFGFKVAAAGESNPSTQTFYNRL